MTASIFTLPVVKVGVSTAAATVTLFTVAGGPILLQGLFANCTTAVGAGAVLLTLNSNPTTGADSALSIASASLALLPIGGLITLTGAVAAAPVLSVGSGAVISTASPMIIQPGTIEAIFAVGDATGVLDFYLHYSPLSQYARVS